MNQEIFQKAGQSVMETEVVQVCNQLGASLKELIEADVRLLNMKRPIIQKYKGKLDKRRKIPENIEILAETTGEDPETIIQILCEDSNSQNKAADRLHKLRGDFPKEKLEHSGVVRIVREFNTKDREFLEKQGEKLIDGIIKRHRDDIKAGRI